MRRFLVVLAFLLICAPAGAAPRALTRLAWTDTGALAGERVLFSQTVGRTVRIRSMPVAGGAATTVYTYAAPRDVGRVLLYATPTQAAALVLFGETTDRAQLLVGTADGGWHPVTPVQRFYAGASVPVDVQLDGGRVFTQEVSTQPDDPVAVVRDPTPRELPYRGRRVRFAGDRVAWTERTGLEVDRILLSDWRTGALLGTTQLQSAVVALALRPDGRVVASAGDNVFEIVPGQPPRRLADVTAALALAGEQVVVQRIRGLGLVTPEGVERPFGIPTETLDRFSADERHVLWSANGCLLVADVADPPAKEPGPGPCSRFEVTEESVRNLRRRWPVKLSCVSGACRGVLRLSFAGRRVGKAVRFRVPAGGHRIVSVRLSPKEVARLRHRGIVTADTGDGSPTPLLL